MWLSNISILNFKNISEANVDFCNGINWVTGANGMGKSNLLESVYYLSMTRSFLRLPDSEVLRRGADAMMLRGQYILEGERTDSINIGYTPPRRKVLKRGGKEYKRISAHIGTIPVVLISPQDHFLITGSPEERRRLMDTVISQADRVYLEALIRYDKALTQRNSMLRAGMSDPLLMEGIEIQMAQEADIIHTARAEWVNAIAEPFSRYYKDIAGTDEAPGIVYASQLHLTSLRDALESVRAKDTLLGHTSAGTHRDDLQMLLSDRDLRHFGSQGQMKTYTIALRMAIYEYLYTCRQVKPLLLLDDIFDKLDAERVGNIMEVVSTSQCFGQIFITDTGRENTDRVLEHIQGNFLLFEANRGSYSLISSKKNPKP